MKEKELYLPVENLLREQGYFLAYEIMIGGYCDMVACKWYDRIGRRIPDIKEVICIEFKIDKIADVIRQAKSNLYFCNKSYVAMPAYVVAAMRQNTLAKFEDAGIGLLSINEKVSQIIQPKENFNLINNHIAKRLWNFKLRFERGATRFKGNKGKSSSLPA